MQLQNLIYSPINIEDSDLVAEYNHIEHKTAIQRAMGALIDTKHIKKRG